jgi:hypothetical protein
MCHENLVCSDWKQEFCGGQPELIEVGNAAGADDWILRSLGLNHSVGFPAAQTAEELLERAKRVADSDMHLSKSNGKLDIDVDGLSGLDASVKGKCTG